MTEKNIYVLRDNVRIFDNKKTEFRLRRGIWNYEEAEIDTETFSEQFQSFFRNMSEALCSEEGFDASLIENSMLASDEKEVLHSLLSQLEIGNFILNYSDRNLNRELSFSLLGYSLEDEQEKMSASHSSKVFVVTDSQHAKSSASELAKVMNLELSFADDDEISFLRNCDLTTKMDGLANEDRLNELKEKYGSYRVILVCMRNLSSKLMHTLNRISVETHIPMVISFIDGPMISMLSVRPDETGCFECFEDRSLSRIQDHVLFSQFEKNAKSRNYGESKGVIPVMNYLINIALSECYLYSVYGTSRFEGRLLSVFVPTLEIQVQDMLRVPFCSACGMIAKEQLKEKNISTRSLIDNFVNKAILKSVNK